MTIVHFFVDKKKRRETWWAYLIYNILALPVNLGLIVVSSVLDLPLIPLFGLPIFWIGFGREKRCWASLEQEYTGPPECSLYQSQRTELVTQLECAGIPDSPYAGMIYLVRISPQTFIIQVLEVWFDNVVVIVKGLELQETSCHAVEASKIDSIICNTTENSSWVNRDVFSAIKVPKDLPLTRFSLKPCLR